MKTLSALFLAALVVALPLACKSAEPDSDEVPCVCGTQIGDLEGCAHASCRDGKSNPDNPDCVCGKLEIPAEKKN